MGYGGTGYATVDVDIVQTDVEAIIDGLCGAGDRTLSDLEERLATIEDHLYYSGVPAAEYLYQMLGELGSIDGDLGNLENYLSGYSSGPLHDGSHGVVDWLDAIESDTSSIESYLGGYSTGPLYDGNNGVVDWLDALESDMSSIENYLAGYSPGPLHDGYRGVVQYLSVIETATELEAGTNIAVGGINSVSVGSSSTVVLAAATARERAVLTNLSDERIDIALGVPAQAGKGIPLAADGAAVVIRGGAAKLAIYAICSSGGKPLAVQTLSVS